LAGQVKDKTRRAERRVIAQTKREPRAEVVQ
jgi:hypothetical protein